MAESQIAIDIPESPADYKLVAQFRIDGEPVSKARARFTKRGSKTVAYTPQKTRDGEARVALAYRAAGGRLDPDTETAYAVHVQFFNGTMQRRDVDNMLKLILDGLNGIAYPDDTQVLEVWGRKSKVAKAEAHTEATVYRIGNIGRPMANCKKCGTPFKTYESWTSNPTGKKYCSPACAGKSPRSHGPRPCNHCGREYLPTTAKSESKYCSKECRHANGNTQVDCSVCGTSFVQHRSWVGERNFCSDTCRRERDRIAHAERRTTHFPGRCLICGSGTTRKEYKRCNPCKLKGKPLPV